MNGYEVLGSDVGPVKIGYAQVQTKSPFLGGPEESSPQIGQVLSGLGHVEGAQSVTTAQQLSAGAGGVENYRSPLVLEMVKNGVHDQVLDKGLASGGVVSEQQMVMQVLSAGRMNEDEDVKAAAGEFSDFYWSSLQRRWVLNVQKQDHLSAIIRLYHLLLGSCDDLMLPG